MLLAGFKDIAKFSLVFCSIGTNSYTYKFDTGLRKAILCAGATLTAAEQAVTSSKSFGVSKVRVEMMSGIPRTITWYETSGREAFVWIAEEGKLLNQSEVFAQYCAWRKVEENR